MNNFQDKAILSGQLQTMYYGAHSKRMSMGMSYYLL
jgi:hypothetical protein